MSPGLLKAISDFTQALVALLVAILANGKADGEALAAAQTPTETKPAEAAAPKGWPKNFSTFRKAWLKAAGSNAQSFVGEIFEKASCVCFTSAQVDFIVMGDPEFERKAISDESKTFVRAELSSQLGFSGILSIRAASTIPDSEKKAAAASAAKTDAKPDSPAQAKSEVTDMQIKAACVELAETLGDREKVLEILVRVGGSKQVSQIDASKYPALLSALKNYNETTTAVASAADFD